MSESDNQNASYVEDELLKRRTIAVSGNITRNSMGKLEAGLLLLQLKSNKPVTLLIDSPGGEIFPALKFCDFMEYVISAPVNAVVVGQCASAATFILLHADSRSCTPHSRFLIHSAHMSDLSITMDDTTETNLQQMLEHAKKVTDALIQMYMKKLGKSRAEVKDYIAQGDRKFNRNLSAKEALEIGLVNNILKENLNIF